MTPTPPRTAAATSRRSTAGSDASGGEGAVRFDTQPPEGQPPTEDARPQRSRFRRHRWQEARTRAAVALELACKSEVEDLRGDGYEDLRTRVKQQLAGDTGRKLQRGELLEIQRVLSSGLNALRAGQWNHDTQITYVLVPDGRGGTLNEVFQARTLMDQYVMNAMVAFAQVGVRWCLRCARPIIGIGRQRYCSATCSQAVRTQRWRRNKRDKFREARRRAYKRKLERERGHPVRVETRRRR